MANRQIPDGPRRAVVSPGELRTTWFIARRGAIESLRDRMTVGVSAVGALAIPFVLVLLVVRPQVSQIGAETAGLVGTLIAAYLFVVGLMPASGSIGIASGMFAGEKEQGTLLPLLATPASNRAIFAGKVLGAVLPTLLYAGIAETTYILEVWLVLGANRLLLLPLALSCAMIALVPAVAVLGAAVASLVSSRVRTYQSAQLLSSLALYPIMAVLFGLATQMQRWGPLALVIAVGTIVGLDVLLVVLGAATWRREEVMARR
jgi:ABC-2 type transport system permease protein